MKDSTGVDGVEMGLLLIKLRIVQSSATNSTATEPLNAICLPTTVVTPRLLMLIDIILGS